MDVTVGNRLFNVLSAYHRRSGDMILLYVKNSITNSNEILKDMLNYMCIFHSDIPSGKEYGCWEFLIEEYRIVEKFIRFINSR